MKRITKMNSDKSNFSFGSNARFFIGLMVIIGIFSSCSNIQQKFKQIEQSSESSNLTEADPIITEDETEETNQIAQEPPQVDPPVEAKILSVQGFASGVASDVNPDQWENWAPRGSTIQLHYSVSGLDAVSNAMQIVKRGSVVNLGQAVDSSVLAEGEDGRQYAFSQYFNLEKQVGGYTFNLPLQYKASVTSPNQYLKTGAYTIYITACTGTILSSCVISNAIDFEVK